MYRDETIDEASAMTPEAPTAAAAVVVPDSGWRPEVVDLLRRAADLAGQHGGMLDAFMEAAYGIYLETNPAVRERLEQAQLLMQVEELRKAGRVGTA